MHTHAETRLVAPISRLHLTSARKRGPRTTDDDRSVPYRAYARSPTPAERVGHESGDTRPSVVPLRHEFRVVFPTSLTPRPPSPPPARPNPPSDPLRPLSTGSLLLLSSVRTYIRTHVSPPPPPSSLLLLLLLHLIPTALKAASFGTRERYNAIFPRWRT